MLMQSWPWYEDAGSAKMVQKEELPEWMRIGGCCWWEDAAGGCCSPGVFSHVVASLNKRVGLEVDSERQHRDIRRQGPV